MPIWVFVDFETNDEIKGYCISAIFRVISQILNSRLIVSRFARMFVCKQLIFIKKFFAHSQRENLQNHESTKSQYSESLLSIDLEKYVLHSTMPNCLISQHIFQRPSALSPAKPRLEMFGCLARLCAPIIPTKLIIYHFFGHVGGLAGIMPCLNANMNHLVFAYNIDYIEIGFGAQMYGTNINIRVRVGELLSILIHSWQELAWFHVSENT